MKKTSKILSTALVAAMLTSVCSAASLSASASSRVASRDDLAGQTVGVCGSFTNWGMNTPDVQLADKGNGIFEGIVTIDEVTEDMISELCADGISTGKYGIQFKVRCNDSWDDSWGDYEPDYERTANSQTNMLIPDSEITIGEPLKFKVIFDTTKAHPDDEFQDPEDPVTWYVSYEIVKDNYDLEFNYEENEDGTITLLGFKSEEEAEYFKNQDGVFVFPDTVDGKTVTKIGYPTNLDGVRFASNKWNENRDLSFHVLMGKEIQLPSTIKEIGDNAFWIPEFVDNKLPEGLEKIGRGSMTHIDVTTLAMPSTLKYIGEYAFYESEIQELVLNDGLEYIGREAFLLTLTMPDKITIPKSVKYIGWDAFSSHGAAEISNGVWVEGLQRSTVFDIYGGGYVEQYMKTYTPFHFDGMKAGYNHNVIGQVDAEPSQSESVNGLKVSGAIPDGAEFKAVATTTKWLEDPLFCYEISLNKDGAEVQPDGYITISIPCEYCNGYVVYIDEETGEMENLNSIYADGYYVFVTDHLSEYGIKFDSDPLKPEEISKPEEKPVESDSQGTGMSTGKTPEDSKPEDSKPEDSKPEENGSQQGSGTTQQGSSGSQHGSGTQQSGGTQQGGGSQQGSSTQQGSGTQQSGGTQQGGGSQQSGQGKTSNDYTPNTGDHTSPIAIAVIAALSGAVLAVFGRKKKTN